MNIKNPEKCLKASNNEVLKGIGMNRFFKVLGVYLSGVGGVGGVGWSLKGAISQSQTVVYEG